MWARFAHFAHHVISIDQAILAVLDEDLDTLLGFVYNRVGTTYTPALALAFFIDSLCYSVRMNLAGLHGPSFLELGQGAFFQQCRTALARITAGDQDAAIFCWIS